MVPATRRPPKKREINHLGVDTPQADLDALQELVRRTGPRGDGYEPRIVEVGSWAGRTALALVSALPRSKVFCVDTWQGSPTDATGLLAKELGPGKVYEAFCENMGPRLLRSVFPCAGHSLWWAKRWTFLADLVFLDAEHTYERVRDDIRAWAPHVRPGGILCGHDYGGDFEGVTRAVDEAGKDGVLGDCVWWKRVL